MEKKRALVVGVGYLGRQIYNLLCPICSKVIKTNYSNLSSSQKFDFFQDDIGEIVGFERLDIIFLSAKIEFHSDTEQLKEAMKRFIEKCWQKRVVYLSSDGIFDGTKGDYKESQEASPVTPYGRNLQLCEKLIQVHLKDYCIIRPSYL